MTTPDWTPFELSGPGKHGDAPRSIRSNEGIGDRLRAAAFAEIQAREAFLWAAHRFEDAPLKLKQCWIRLAESEQQHLDWLLARMKELDISITGRKVSDDLWYSLVGCKTAREFAHYIANAEERGRKAGVRFYESLCQTDPVTADIFKRIADEEIGHIAVAEKFFPTLSEARHT